MHARGARGRPTPASTPRFFPAPRAPRSRRTPRENSPTHLPTRGAPARPYPPGAPAQSGASQRICLSTYNSIAVTHSAPRGSVIAPARAMPWLMPARPPAAQAAQPSSLHPCTCAPMEHSQSPPCTPGNSPSRSPPSRSRTHAYTQSNTCIQAHVVIALSQIDAPARFPFRASFSGRISPCAGGGELLWA